ncbi:nematode resistance protein-like HSPRO2 [Typha angustifolia]|uniref:nematode resistance protein-like HSPRO2 n=1 Tax=Typha angustifolia TaxID=59011 RepID=UPI003C2AD3BB
MIELELETANNSMAIQELSSISDNLCKGEAYLSNSSSSPGDEDDTSTAAYGLYLRLPELSKLWSSREFPGWRNESILKPALQALEITFRFISIALSDPRPYANHLQWERRLEWLAAREIELIAAFCEEEDLLGGGAPVTGLSSSEGVLPRDRSSHEVWRIPGTSRAVVSRTSEASLLPRLAAWQRSEDVATKIAYQIESQMRRCAFTLGLGEPNLTGKPSLEYDLVVRPLDLHLLQKSPSESRNSRDFENEKLFSIHQISESWLHAAGELLSRIDERIDGRDWAKAASDCWILERIWRLLEGLEELHLLMDPDDFLRLKSQLGIRRSCGSASLARVTCASRDLKGRVPWVLGVEADPSGGPRVQESAMELFRCRHRGEEGNIGKIDLLQAFQAIEVAVRGFYFGYRQVIVAMMGSLEASGNRSPFLPPESLDSLSQLFLEPPYFPSLDAAKTFLGDYWQNRRQ